MSPVDPDKIKSVKPRLIDYDRPCVGCGYNLVGLMSDGLCPECGRKIQIRKKDIRRYADNLVNAPMAWLGVFATGSFVLLLSALGLFISMGVAVWMGLGSRPIGALVAAGAGLTWFTGVWIVTRPRPVMKATIVDPRKEWAALRWSARASQFFWVILALLIAGSAKTGAPAFAWAAIPSFAIATLGMIPLCALLSNLAHWGSDTTLAGHFRACAWVVGFSGTVVTLHLINAVTGSVVVGGLLAAVIALFLIVCVLAPYIYMTFCCFQLQGISRWAMLNHATAEAKDQRLRERAAQAASVPTRVPPSDAVDLAAFNLGDSDMTKAAAPAKPAAKAPRPPGA